MPGTEVYYDQQKRRQQRKTSTGEDVAGAEATERLGSTKGKDLGALEKRGGFVPPKQEPGEDSATYAKRVRKAREEHTAKQAKPVDTAYMRGRNTDDAAEALLERKEKR